MTDAGTKTKGGAENCSAFSFLGLDRYPGGVYDGHCGQIPPGGIHPAVAAGSRAPTRGCRPADVMGGRETDPGLQDPGREEKNMTENTCPACAERKKKRTEEEKKALLTRLKKAEGQIRGIEKMVEEDAYCPDVLMQVSAVTQALNSFNKELLACHVKSCVAEDIKADRPEAVDELVKLLQKLMK